MALAALNKISEQLPSITKQHAYAASCVVTTVALTALNYYAPVTFFLAGAPLTVVHVIFFNEAVQKLDHTEVRAWAIIACIVACAFNASQIAYFIQYLPLGVRALRTLNTSSALLSFAIFTSSIGVNGAAVEQLYRCGLELAQKTTWKPMKAHMENRSSRLSIESFMEKCEFSLSLIDPSSPSVFVSNKVKNIVSKFTPQTQKKDKRNQFFIPEIKHNASQPYVKLAGEVACKLTIIITGLAPVIIYPRLAAIGMVIGIASHFVPTLADRIDSLHMPSEAIKGLPGLFFARYQLMLVLAKLRPFTILVTKTPTNEMISYSEADTLGKVRFLACEFFCGYFFLNSSFDGLGYVPGLGALAQGIAQGQELATVLNQKSSEKSRAADREGCRDSRPP